ncbi:MAG: OB-fold nucleic acid binding domain-containing protein, partial [Chloroflexota bacterium]
MPLSSEKLYKIFKLEAEFSYENLAVVGGLQKLAESWAAEARAEGTSESLIPAITSILHRYPDLDIDDRWGALLEIGDLLSIPKIAYLPNPAQRESPRLKPEIPKEKAQDKTVTPSQTKVSRPKRVKGTQETSRYPIADTTIGLDAPTTVIRGVGAKQAEHLNILGLSNIEDMLYFFPRRYDDYSLLKTIGQLRFGEEVTIIARVVSITTYPTKNKRKITEAVVSDTTGTIRLLWFNQDYHMRYLRKGMFISISGKVESYLGRSVIYHPDYEPIDQQQLHTNRIVPVYPLTAKITQRWLRRTMFNTVEYWSERVSDFMPDSILQETQLPDITSALKQAHFPDSQEELEQARQRIAFDEIFLLQLGVIRQKYQWQSLESNIYSVSDEWLQERITSLPFELTKAQKQTLSDLRKDLASGHPMNRLLQGDVGSGKTVIAGLGMAMVIASGAQSAFMAPTSILAEQHYQSMLELFTETESTTPLL